MSSLPLKVGDLEPGLTAQLLDHDGQPANLTTAEGVELVLLLPSSELVTRTANILEAPAGRVFYEWQEGDTDLPGAISGEFVVDWGSGRKQTYPGSGTVKVIVRASLTSKHGGGE